MTAVEMDTVDVPVAQVVDVHGTPSSGLLLAVPNPRGVIVALHGGASKSAYYDCPGFPRHSLLRTGAANSFTVLALDRPGYEASFEFVDRFTTPEQRVDWAYAAVDAHLGSRSRGAGTFILAHSVGCELGVRMAADVRGRDLLGIELSGTGTEHQPKAASVLVPRDTKVAKPDGAGVRELLWNPARLYPPELSGGGPISAPGPKYEYEVVRDWPRMNFPDLAAQIQVPVHFTAGEFENVWRNDPDALHDIGALFTMSPRVEVEQQFDGGHNLSLGYTAMAYHMNILSFVEECINDANRPGH
ncbi:alpha/beta hydrolase [Williamsia sp.]|uniref:alpha/beta hydrolase n=1 Tax=Williamsia sp. TaxID=1872085 RepID=UPI002F9571F4